MNRFCATCAGERLFEQPPCLDGHEPDTCPEWACADCGHAVLLGPPATMLPTAPQLVLLVRTAA